MKKKILLSVFVIYLILTLVGCSIIIPVIPDGYQKEEVKEVINDFWLALSNKQYGLAKIYCILYGSAYYAVEEYQSQTDSDYITLNWIPYINWVKIIGSKATVDLDITLVSTVCFEGICSSESETFCNYPMYLTKIDGIWKLN